jgi:hypothetical protein
VSAEIVRAMKLGATVQIAAGAAGVSEGAFYDWMARGRADAAAGETTIFSDFSEAIDRARHTGDLQLLASVRGTTQGRRCPTCQGAGAMAAHLVGGRADDTRLVRCPACKGSTFATAPDGRLALDLLSRRHPEAFGRKDQRRVEVSGEGGGPVRVDVRAIAATIDLGAVGSLGVDELTALAWNDDAEVEAVPSRAALPARAVVEVAEGEAGAPEAEAAEVEGAPA